MTQPNDSEQQKLDYGRAKEPSLFVGCLVTVGVYLLVVIVIFAILISAVVFWERHRGRL